MLVAPTASDISMCSQGSATTAFAQRASAPVRPEHSAPCAKLSHSSASTCPNVSKIPSRACGRVADGVRQVAYRRPFLARCRCRDRKQGSFLALAFAPVFCGRMAEGLFRHGSRMLKCRWAPSASCPFGRCESCARSGWAGGSRCWTRPGSSPRRTTGETPVKALRSPPTPLAHVDMHLRRLHHSRGDELQETHLVDWVEGVGPALPGVPVASEAPAEN